MVTQNILIASVLKPCDDTRMYEKMALTLAQSPEVFIHIIGHKVNRKSIIPNIKFYPIFDFKRISFDRFLAPWKYAILILKVKPNTIVVSTHELLLVTVLNKILFGTEIYYDIQENYYQNIALTNTFPKWIRGILAWTVRTKESILAPFFDHLIMAEACYSSQLPFLKTRKWTIIENKFSPPNDFQNHTNSRVSIQQKLKNNLPIRFIYTGTIAEEYGIFQAIEFIKKWVLIYPGSILDIIGYCPKESIRENLVSISQGLDFIRIKNDGKDLVPHAEILKAIEKADIALLPYQPLKYTKDRIPTKLYECMAYQLPMIIQHNQLWEEQCNPWNSALFIDFSNPDITQISNSLSTFSFYNNGMATNIFWESEGKKLIELLIK